MLLFPIYKVQGLASFSIVVRSFSRYLDGKKHVGKDSPLVTSGSLLNIDGGFRVLPVFFTDLVIILPN